MIVSALEETTPRYLRTDYALPDTGAGRFNEGREAAITEALRMMSGWAKKEAFTDSARCALEIAIGRIAFHFLDLEEKGIEALLARGSRPETATTAGSVQTFAPVLTEHVADLRALRIELEAGVAGGPDPDHSAEWNRGYASLAAVLLDRLKWLGDSR